jgi:signal transduction histidine kinase
VRWERLRIRSYRGRIALAIALALAVSLLVVQLILRGVYEARVHDAVAESLRQQAEAVAFSVERDGAGGADDAARFLPDTRVLVRQDGDVIWWEGPLHGDLEARATVRRGDVEVTLERGEPSGVIAAWVLPALLAAGLVAVAGLVWFLAGRVSRRLSASVADLADTAEAVAEGDMTVRAREGDDELGRLAVAFNRMAARLGAAEARQRAFLADVAHELRTPVTAIEGFAGALDDGTAASAEDRAEAAAFIRQEASRLRTLIGDLQELTWLDLDPPVRRELVDLAEVGRTAVARLAADASSRGVRLIAPEGSVEAMTDPAHVDTILANLLTNALRHTPRGGRVEVLTVAAGGEAWLRVADSGEGIAPEHLPYLFERLYRIESGRSRGDGGSGLGLSIVKRLVVLLGGDIEVRSAPASGSTFTVRLPRGLPPGAEKPRAGERPTLTTTQ